MKSHSSGNTAEVLVTGGNSRQGLAVVRSLARQGVSFVVVGEDKHSLAFSSRFAKKTLLSPSPTSDPEAFFEFTLNTIRKMGIQLVMPVAESTVLIFDQYRQQIEPHARLAMASSTALRTVLDKRLNLEMAEKLGVPCPRQFRLEKLEQIPQLIETLGFPLVMKPPGSRLDPNLPGHFAFKVLYPGNEAELRSYLDRYCPDGVYPLFQEYAAGEMHNLCAFAVQGETVALHEYRSLRRLPLTGGVGVLREIIEPNPEAEKYARLMLRELNWDGVAHVAFVMNCQRGRMWYMETNGRFWASTQGSIHAGWDFPLWQYEYFLKGKRPEPGPIRIGNRTCWLRGDLEAFLSYLIGDTRSVDGSLPGKFRAFLHYLSGLHPALHHDVFRWDDPLPALLDHWQLMRWLVQRIHPGKK